jgi:riboflavin synthase
VFTGIVEELGTVAAIDDLGDAARLSVHGPIVTGDAKPGDSIAVAGVCLTVVDTADGTFTADVMKETLTRSSLGGLTAGSAVNLERAATLATRLGGHLVQGHVDGVGTVLERTPGEHWEIVRVSLPTELSRYLVEKGSITIDGISLTVVGVHDAGAPAGPDDPAEGASFSVSLIPETLRRTTLGSAAPGTTVNLEVDVIAKYVERLVRQ